MIQTKKYITFFFVTTLTLSVFSVDLNISLQDIRLEQDKNEGYHLYVNANNDIKSILLTETTKDPNGVADNYSYRATEWNKFNGDEKRILNGEFLSSEYSKYSLIDSTPEPDSQFGTAFHIYIPNTLIWGYSWTRNGTTKIGMGTFINIRSFEKKNADYTGEYFDNPYMFDFDKPIQKKTKPTNTPKEDKVALTNNYSETASNAFKEISTGMMIYSRGPETIVKDVITSFNEINPKENIDVVFAIDATGSMWDDIGTLQKDLIPELEKALQKCGHVRLGLLWYRDYGDNFLLDGLPVRLNKFTTDSDVFFSTLKKMRIKKGTLIGGDIPEAVYEALYASMIYYPWDPTAQKKVILIGDAEPHPIPRGIKQISKESIQDLSTKLKITIDCIITPDKSY
ncbi:MAG: hypothetical protein BKP49_03005 [Treponema sp. CETP13]|nr:MAG: hypothetical protein BKP49_03005 [Treponema sp. CETP13]